MRSRVGWFVLVQFDVGSRAGQSEGVQGRYRVGSLDLVDLEVDSPAGGSDTVETRCERCRVG
jgi:hypothetical protein